VTDDRGVPVTRDAGFSSGTTAGASSAYAGMPHRQTARTKKNNINLTILSDDFTRAILYPEKSL
jgi:hypothetical protein